MVTTERILEHYLLIYKIQNSKQCEKNFWLGFERLSPSAEKCVIWCVYVCLSVGMCFCHLIDSDRVYVLNSVLDFVFAKRSRLFASS